MNAAKTFIQSLSFLFFSFSLLGQNLHTTENLFPVHSKQFYQGFVEALGGEQLDFLQNLQPGNVALFIKATDGTEFIEFATEPMPVHSDDNHITFLWEAAISKNTEEIPVGFDFSVNGEKEFTFFCIRDSLEKNWVYKNDKGLELSFITSKVEKGKIEKGKGDFFGFMFLTVPKKLYPVSKPLKINIHAQAAKSSNWHMSFQEHVQTTSSAYVLQALKKIGKEFKQPIIIEHKHIGLPENVDIMVDGKKYASDIFQLGDNEISLLLNDVDAEKERLVTIERDGKILFSHRVLQKPVRKFEVYFLPHSHVDIGFTHVQSEVEKMQWRNYDLALDLAEKTKDYPDGSKYKWNVEVMWAVEGYLKNATPEKRKAFIDAVKTGSIGLDALYGSELTGLQRPEELMNITNFSNRLEEKYGIKTETAMITDVPGYVWGTVPALSQNGIKYFSIGPNHMPHLAHGGYQVGYTFEAWGDIPFYWTSPSGKEKVLFWMSTHGYSWFHDWLLGELHKSGGKPIVKFLDELDEKGYPYDIVQLRYTAGDNGPPDTNMSDFIKDWNEQYDYPKFRIATTIEMFEAFETKYAKQIPTYSGDFTPYWEDGAASSATETSINRNAVEKIVQAETLWAICNREGYNPAKFDEAWTKATLFSEHTWGSITSKSDPDGQLAVDQWNIKQGFAVDADKLANDLIDQAVFEVSGTKEHVEKFWVFNTTSWKRTQLVRIPSTWKRHGDLVMDQFGKAVSSQLLSTGELAFIAEDIPPFSGVNYSLENGKMKTSGDVSVSENRLSNELISIQIDKKTGSITSLKDQNISFDLVDTNDEFGFNEYWYTGLDADNPQRNDPVSISIKENGPLVSSILIKSNAPGANSLLREIEIISGINQLNITNVVDKTKVLDNENVRFSFPFHVPDGEVKIDLAWTVMQPEIDQIKGANKNFFCAQRWVDISNTEGGATWATIDAPIFEIGEMHGQKWMSNMRTRPWLKQYKPSNRLFSWVMNNAWFVNYKGYQEGKTIFRYAIQPHQEYNSTQAKKFGIASSQPFLLFPGSPKNKTIESPLHIKGDEEIIASSFKPLRKGNGVFLRLFNTCESKKTVSLELSKYEQYNLYLSNQKEAQLSSIGNKMDFGPWEIKTIKIVFD